MELPLDVLVHNELMGMKGTRGRLLRIHDRQYEVVCRFGDKEHRMLLPMQTTALIQSEPEPEAGDLLEVER